MYVLCHLHATHIHAHCSQVAELPQVVRALVEGVSSWKDVEAKYPAFVEQENTH